MGSLVNSVLGSITGAKETKGAANLAAEQQRQAAQSAAFRPVGMTTRFGTSQFTRATDPATGLPYIESGSYEAAPELQALQDQLFGQFGQGFQLGNYNADQYMPLAGAANQLFNFGAQQLGENPQAARQRYIEGQQGLLSGFNEQALAGIRNNLYQTGRGGLATGGTSTGMQATNPELAAYYNSLAQQNAQISAGADAAVQAQQQSGANLFNQGAGLLGTLTSGQTAAYSPLQNLLGLSGQVDALAQQPYQLGLQLGTAQIPGQTTASGLFGQAAQTQYSGVKDANAANAALLAGIIQGAGAAAGGGGKKTA